MKSPILLAILAIHHSNASAESVTVTVSAGKHDRAGVPVFLPLPDPLNRFERFTGERIDNGNTVHVQLASNPKPQLVWMIGQTMKAGESRQYRLSGIAA
ncbi:MAG: hypothetical protein QF437_29495, partial [Planctomycetota bacterium]|nr:hypothetical protein [Planctomycetota bacterium]